MLPEIGKVFRYPHDPEGVTWRILSRQPDGSSMGHSWQVYRCEQLTGDTSIYPRDRNADGTIDFAADEGVLTGAVEARS
jgi:hypothetical protein